MADRTRSTANYGAIRIRTARRIHAILLAFPMEELFKDLITDVVAGHIVVGVHYGLKDMIGLLRIGLNAEIGLNLLGLTK